jgi:hypothetical protein
MYIPGKRAVHFAYRHSFRSGCGIVRFVQQLYVAIRKRL